MKIETAPHETRLQGRLLPFLIVEIVEGEVQIQIGIGIRRKGVIDELVRILPPKSTRLWDG